MRSFAVPSSRHARSFCTRCGSALPNAQMDGALLVVPAGSLDSAVDVRPSAHICTASRANWDHHLKDVLEIEGLPR